MDGKKGEKDEYAQAIPRAAVTEQACNWCH